MGTPGTGRQIRQFPVEKTASVPGVRGRREPAPIETQQEIIARYRQRDREDMRPRTARGIEAASRGDDSILFTQDLRAQSSNTETPKRPRAEGAGYDSAAGTVRIRFRVGADKSSPDGAIYEYYGVPRSVWKNLQRASSPGRFITRVLDTYPYTKVDGSFEPRGFYDGRAQ